MKKGDIVRYTNPYADEINLTFTLLENPDSGRVLAQANVTMTIKPTVVLDPLDIEVVENPGFSE